ncbi:MAG: hypothetical protein NC112_09485 [Oxalobacter formigenes]|nr:hypothetical protein [Oxalobacter formigenes]
MVRLRTAARHLKDYAKVLRALRDSLPVHGPSIRDLADDADGLADSLMKMASEQATAGRVAADFDKARE